MKELHIFTSPSSDHQNKDDRFVGKQIDQSFLKFLKFDDNLISLSDGAFHLFSCCKFNLSDTKTGLIIRGPSQYEESAICLYTWDNKLKMVTNIMNLSDAFGDEGWHFIQNKILDREIVMESVALLTSSKKSF